MKNLFVIPILTIALASAPLLRAEPDAGRLALAREVIALTQADKMFQAIVPQMEQMSKQMAAPMMDKLTPEQKEKVEAAQKKIVAVALEGAKAMVAKFDTVYAEVFSEDELKAMKKFFMSAEGKSMIEKQPLLMQQAMPLAQQMQAEMMPKMQAAVGELEAALRTAAPSADGAPTVGPPDSGALGK